MLYECSPWTPAFYLVDIWNWKQFQGFTHASHRLHVTTPRSLAREGSEVRHLVESSRSQGSWGATQAGRKSVSSHKPHTHTHTHTKELRASYRLDFFKFCYYFLPHFSVLLFFLDQVYGIDKRGKGVSIKNQNQQQECFPDLVPVKVDSIWERTERV